MSSSEIEIGVCEELKHMFPEETVIINTSGTSENPVINLRTKDSSKEKFKYWLEEHQKLSGVTYRVESTRPKSGEKVIYKAIYRCHHNTHPTSHCVKKPSAKHTGCNAKLNVTIISTADCHKDRTRDQSHYDYPTIITLRYKHNHKIDMAGAVKVKDPEKSVKRKFTRMLHSHHKTAKTLDLNKQTGQVLPGSTEHIRIQNASLRRINNDLKKKIKMLQQKIRWQTERQKFMDKLLLDPRVKQDMSEKPGR